MRSSDFESSACWRRCASKRPTLEIDGWALEAVLGAEILGHYRAYQILGALERSALKEEPTTRGLRIAMLEELERIFFLLGLLYPGTDFRAAWEALRSGNPVLRDQALDLLESRLKPEMRTLLVPLIDPEVPGDERMALAEKLAGHTGDHSSGGGAGAGRHRWPLAQVVRGVCNRRPRPARAQGPARRVGEGRRSSPPRDRAPGASSNSASRPSATGRCVETRGSLPDPSAVS